METSLTLSGSYPNKWTGGFIRTSLSGLWMNKIVDRVLGVVLLEATLADVGSATERCHLPRRRMASGGPSPLEWVLVVSVPCTMRRVTLVPRTREPLSLDRGMDVLLPSLLIGRNPPLGSIIRILGVRIGQRGA